MNRVELFKSLKTDNELMDFMDSNITYGWIDIKGNTHIDSLKGIKYTYKVSSINEILEIGLGTCIEQAKLEKFFFDKIGLENKLYCYRCGPSEIDFDENSKMHCFVIFKYDGKWYHFEHSDRKNKGIHEYSSLDDALGTTLRSIEAHDKVEKLVQIPEIPDGMSYLAFCYYVSTYENEGVKVFSK